MIEFTPEDWTLRGLHALRGNRVRTHRGDIGLIILCTLKEKPMHGYEIIRTFEERSHGFWRPSAGSVYPTLQLLEEQEFVVSQELAGKKVFSITQKGIEHCKERGVAPSWEGKQRSALNFRGVMEPFQGTMKEIRKIIVEGNESDIANLKQVLSDTKVQIDQISSRIGKTKS